MKQSCLVPEHLHFEFSNVEGSISPFSQAPVRLCHFILCIYLLSHYHICYLYSPLPLCILNCMVLYSTGVHGKHPNNPGGNKCASLSLKLQL